MAGCDAAVHSDAFHVLWPFAMLETWDVVYINDLTRLLQASSCSTCWLMSIAPQCSLPAPCVGALQPRHLLLVQVGGDAILKALSAAEFNAPDATASAPVLQGFTTVIR